MIATNQSRVEDDRLTVEISQILAALGGGASASVPYDTAWIARLSPHYAGFEGALPWLRENQHADGSWGGEALHYHDRFICTLAAMIALKTVGDHGDEKRIRRAEQFLWREYTHLHQDAHETIAFPVLSLSLLEEATLLGLDVPRNPEYDVFAVEKKLAILQYCPRLWRGHTMSHSLEALRAAFPDDPDFLEGNGSVGVSPAATAAVLLRSQSVDYKALEYLHEATGEDGGASGIYPVDVFEVAWSLNYLRASGALSADHPDVRRVLDWLWSVWSPEKGIGFSSYFSVPDCDDTAACYVALKWGGYPVDVSVFTRFEEGDHFCCFPGEIGLSLSTNARLLSVLRMSPEHPQTEKWIEKIVALLRQSDRKGIFWFDKWHVSPYYLAQVATDALIDLADDLIEPRIKWLLATQRSDGGWGHYGGSTPEETAYALKTLLCWDRGHGRVDPTRIEVAGKYVRAHCGDQRLTPLWIGKCLYTPTLVVRSALLASVCEHLEWRQR